MHIVYARTSDEGTPGPRLFLAGPTPRRADVPSWRPTAFKLLQDAGFSGTVYAPEDSTGVPQGNYDHQIEWETEGLTKADIIIFWIPRELKDMPGFTTNVEFGMWVASGKVVAGAPEGAVKMKYLEKTAERFGVPWFNTLEETVEEALKRLP